MGGAAGFVWWKYVSCTVNGNESVRFKEPANHYCNDVFAAQFPACN